MAALVDAHRRASGRVDLRLAVMSLLIAVPADAAGIYLHRGSRGANVKTLETRLHTLGLLSGPPWTAGTATPRGWQSEVPALTQAPGHR